MRFLNILSNQRQHLCPPASRPRSSMSFLTVPSRVSHISVNGIPGLMMVFMYFRTWEDGSVWNDLIFFASWWTIKAVSCVVRAWQRNQACAMTVWRYGPSKYGRTVDAVNDSVRPSFLNFGTVMTVHDSTVDGTVQKSQKGQRTDLWPQNGHFLLISECCSIICKTNDWCNKEKERKKNSICVLKSWSQLFTAKKHLMVDLHSNYGGRSPWPSDRLTPSFLTLWRYGPSTVP